MQRYDFLPMLHPPRSRLNILIVRAALRRFLLPPPQRDPRDPGSQAGFCSWFRGEQRGGAWPGEWSAMDLISESCKRYWVLGSHSIGYKWVKSDLPPQGLGQQRFWLCCKFSHSPFMLCTITAHKGLSWPHRLWLSWFRNYHSLTVGGFESIDLSQSGFI